MTKTETSAAEIRIAPDDLHDFVSRLWVSAGSDETEAKLLALVEWVKAAPTLDGHGEIYVPGEPERGIQEKRRAIGIPIDPTTWKQVVAAAQQAGMPAERIAAVRII